MWIKKNILIRFLFKISNFQDNILATRNLHSWWCHCIIIPPLKCEFSMSNWKSVYFLQTFNFQYKAFPILNFLNWNFCVFCLYVFFSNYNKVNGIISFIFINQNVRIVPIKDDSTVNLGKQLIIDQHSGLTLWDNHFEAICFGLRHHLSYLFFRFSLHTVRLLCSIRSSNHSLWKIHFELSLCC